MTNAEPPSCRVRLLRGRSDQTIVVPTAFALPGDEAIVTRDGARLIVQPLAASGQTNSLAALLASWEPIADRLADPDEGLLPVRDVEL